VFEFTGTFKIEPHTHTMEENKRNSASSDEFEVVPESSTHSQNVEDFNFEENNSLIADTRPGLSYEDAVNHVAGG